MMQPLEKWGWVLVAVGLTLDVITTFFGISVGMIETNPVIFDILHGLGWVGFIGTKLVVVGLAVGVRQLVPSYRWAVPYCIGTPWFIAGLSNGLWITLYLLR